MRSILLIAVMLALAQASLGQPAPDTLWTRTYGSPNSYDDDIAFSVQQTTDGGYIVAGLTGILDACDFYLVKTDSSGDTLWTRAYGGIGYDYTAFSVQQTTDGGYIVAGGANQSSVFLVKTDSAGSILWIRDYTGGAYSEGYSVQQTTDGGYVVAGVATPYGGGGTDFYLVKTNAAGNTLWTRTYGGSGDDRGRSVRQTADGGYAVAGYTSSFGAGQNDFYLVRTDVQGDTLWTRTYGGSWQDLAHSVQQTADGGYIVAGSTTSFGAGGWDFYLVKTNSLGDTLWTRTYGGSGDDYGHSAQQTTDGGYVAAGTAYGYLYYLVKTDPTGNVLWAATYGEEDCVQSCRSVQQTADGGYIMAGEIWSYEGVDMYLVKTEPEVIPAGYVRLISSGPPDWAYRLHWTIGAVSGLVFTNFCNGTVGCVSGDAATVGWTATNYADSIVFVSDTWLSSGSIDTFWLSHPYCSDYVTWRAGDRSGTIEGPLPVELTTFDAVAGDGEVILRWRTASELDNDHFVLYKREAGEDDLCVLAQIPGQGTTTEPHDYDYVDRWVQNGMTYQYQISDVDIAGRETIHERIASATPSAAVLPADFALHAPYPNPFNPTTVIRYDVRESGLVSLRVFDLLGREVATLVQGTVPAGSYALDWNAGELPSGIYLCRMETHGFAATRKVILLK